MADTETKYDVKKIAAAIEKKQGLRAGAKRKTWFLTLNNPCEHIPECMGMQPEEVVDWANRHWCVNSKGELKKNRGSGCCYERGLAEHTDHIHIVLCAVNTGCTAETVVRAFPTADIEVAKGSVEDLCAYLAKTGAHADKEDTTVVEPCYLGEKIVSNPSAKKSDDDGDNLSRTEQHRKLVLDAIWKDGYTYEDILSDPELAVYASGMRKDMLIDAIAVRDKQLRTKKRDVRGVWLIGPDDSHNVLEAARAWLTERFGWDWGEYDFGRFVQSKLSEKSRAVLVYVSSITPIEDVSLSLNNLLTCNPIQFNRTYDDAFWANWETVVIVSSSEPVALVAGPFKESILHRVDPHHVGGWDGKKTLEHVSKFLDKEVDDPDDSLSWEQIANYFDAKSVVSIPASAIEANDGYIPLTWDGDAPTLGETGIEEATDGSLS